MNKESEKIQACQENVALYANEVMFDSISEDAQCTLGWLKTSRIENQAMGLTKNSPYTETINYQYANFTKKNFYLNASNDHDF